LSEHRPVERRRETEFRRLLLEVVDEGLVAVVGKPPAQAIYYHLERDLHLRRRDIPRKPEAFAQGLERLFGLGAPVLLRAILRKLYRRMGLNFEEKEGYAFADYVQQARGLWTQTAYLPFPAPPRDREAKMEKAGILEFVKKMKPTDHVALFYTDPEDKHRVLFTYLKAGLEEEEAAAYVAGQEACDQVRRAMEKFGIDVERHKRKGALKVIPYQEWYIIDGKFDMAKTLRLWKKLLEEAKARGFQGLRVAGEMACFFNHGMVKELVAYERALHRTLEIPLTAICAYDSEVVAREGKPKLLPALLKAHSTAIILGPKTGLVKSE